MERRMRLVGVAGLLAALCVGCTSSAVITRPVYEDRAVWITLETNPLVKEGEAPRESPQSPPLSTEMVAGWLRGFRVLTDRGLLGMVGGRSGEVTAFADQEITTLAPHLAKGLKMAKPHERVAYCMTADYSPNERFITTGWVYVKPPHLHYMLVEYHTPVKIASPAVPTAVACRTKPQPGVKTADRYFRLSYEPEEAVEKFGWASFMAGTDRNSRGEVVFKLANLYHFKPRQAPQNASPASTDDRRGEPVEPKRGDPPQKRGASL